MCRSFQPERICQNAITGSKDFSACDGRCRMLRQSNDKRSNAEKCGRTAVHPVRRIGFSIANVITIPSSGCSRLNKAYGRETNTILDRAGATTAHRTAHFRLMIPTCRLWSRRGRSCRLRSSGRLHIWPASMPKENPLQNRCSGISHDGLIG